MIMVCQYDFQKDEVMKEITNRINKGLHQLVAECFLKLPDNSNSYEVHHKDFNPYNNNVSNLIYLTPEEHRKIHAEHDKMLREQRTGSKNNGL